MTHKTILVPIFSLSQQTVCQRRTTNQYLFFAHERESLLSAPAYRNQCNSFLSHTHIQSLRFSLPAPSTPLLCLPPTCPYPSPPLRSLIPTFPPAMIKGQWQIYTHSAAQPHGLLKVRGNDLEIPYRQM